MPGSLWDKEAFRKNLEQVGTRLYHDKHPFHRLMNSGQLSALQVQGWIVNRYYYQACIPIKDAAILSNCPLPEVRRAWIHRLSDHDGGREGEGGLEAWLRLGESAGLERREVASLEHVLPGVRFAVDAYLQFARTKPWQVAVASSLTELFAPDLMKRRLAAFERFYAWIDAKGLDYFRARLTQARSDSGEGLELVLRHCATPELQRAAVEALGFKCDVLWGMLDAIQGAYGPQAPLAAEAPPQAPAPLA